MARGVNKVILIGNLGKDPETRSLPSGEAVANITLATSESWKDKQTGEQKEKTEWHKVVFFKRLAELAGQYLKTGSQVYIEGALRTRKWQDKEGKDHYSTEVVASEMQMLGGKGGGSGGSSAGFESGEGGGKRSSKPESAPAAADKGFEDDDIPF